MYVKSGEIPSYIEWYIAVSLAPGNRGSTIIFCIAWCAPPDVMYNFIVLDRHRSGLTTVARQVEKQGVFRSRLFDYLMHGSKHVLFYRL
jgi:hypothetical protein